MPRDASWLLLGLALLGASGCLKKQFTHDGVALHKATVELYTDQAITNLIRAKCHMPFVLLSYSKISLTDKLNGKGNTGTDQTVSTARDLFDASATRGLTNLYSIGGSGDDTRIMSFNADPVLNQEDIYLQYVAFANDPALFCVSDKAPPGPVHLMRKHEHKYYWVPPEAGPAFLNLVMQTAIMRGPVPPPVVADAYDRKIVDVTLEKPVKVKDKELFNGTVELNEDVPNGEGVMVVTLKRGRRVKIDVWPFDDLEVGKATKKISIQFPSSTADPKEVLELKGERARIHSDEFPPEKWRKASAP